MMLAVLIQKNLSGERNLRLFCIIMFLGDVFEVYEFEIKTKWTSVLSLLFEIKWKMWEILF